jgi:hypothetical protein
MLKILQNPEIVSARAALVDAVATTLLQQPIDRSTAEGQTAQLLDRTFDDLAKRFKKLPATVKEHVRPAKAEPDAEEWV